MNNKSVVKLLCVCARLSSPLYVLTRWDVSVSTMSLFLSLLDILKSLILLIFKKEKKRKEEGFLPRAAEEEFVFSGFLFPDEGS